MDYRITFFGQIFLMITAWINSIMQVKIACLHKCRFYYKCHVVNVEQTCFFWLLYIANCGDDKVGDGDAMTLPRGAPGDSGGAA